MLLAGKTIREGWEIPRAVGSFVRAGSVGSLSQSCILYARGERPSGVHRALGETELLGKTTCSKGTRRERIRVFLSRFSSCSLWVFYHSSASGFQVRSSLSTACLTLDLTGPFLFLTKVRVISRSLEIVGYLLPA